MDKYKEHITGILKDTTDLKEISLEIPPDPDLGDYAFPCFILSKELKKSPADIAKDLAQKIRSDKLISEVRPVGPYLNFFIDPKHITEETISKIKKEKDSYGKGKKKKEKVMIEYCQVNTHKAFHVGHLRGTILGSSLVNISRFAGYNTVAANYQGDIGSHVAKVIWYLKNNDVEYPKDHKGRWLGKIYQKANTLLSDENHNERYKQKVSEVLQKLECGDPELTKLWKKTRQWSLDDFEEFYKIIGAKFDEYFFESQFEKKGKEIVSDMLKKVIAEKSEGAIIIDLEKHKLPKFLLLKSDGTALYSTKDLALAAEKFNKYDVDKSVYVVGSEQKLYFEQIFKTLEIYGFDKARDCVHVPYGLVTLKGGKISSREGELIYAEELAEEVISEAKNQVSERHEDISEKEKDKRARQIGISAIRFSFLSQDNNKEIVFEKERSLSFEGETGPYCQYAHARICSIIEKYGKSLPNSADISLLKEKRETMMVKMLASFPGIIQEASSNFKPSTITRYCLDLSQLFNEYYHETPILKAEENIISARLSLISAVKQVLRNALGLLGIDAPEKM